MTGFTMLNIPTMKNEIINFDYTYLTLRQNVLANQWYYTYNLQVIWKFKESKTSSKLPIVYKSRSVSGIKIDSSIYYYRGSKLKKKTRKPHAWDLLKNNWNLYWKLAHIGVHAKRLTPLSTSFVAV